MDQKIQNLKEGTLQYIGASSLHIRKILGPPKENSTDEVWFYEIARVGFYHHEIAFSFRNKTVASISAIKYLMEFKIDEQILYDKKQDNAKL